MVESYHLSKKSKASIKHILPKFQHGILWNLVVGHWFLEGIYFHQQELSNFSYSLKDMSRLVGKPTMWFPNRSDTNRAAQTQKTARSLKFQI